MDTEWAYITRPNTLFFFFFFALHVFRFFFYFYFSTTTSQGSLIWGLKWWLSVIRQGNGYSYHNFINKVDFKKQGKL